MSCMEIAFEAEMNRCENPEYKDEAWLLCAEDNATIKSNINELRNLIYEKGECYPHRMDDAYLLRFLRARRSVPARAHRLLVRYCRFRGENPGLWRDVDMFSTAKLRHVYEGVLYDRPDVGRLIVCRIGEWDLETTSAEDIIRAGLILLEVGVLQPKIQVLGGTFIMDCEGLSLRHMRMISTTAVRNAMCIMGYAFPVHQHQRNVHVVNCSRIVEFVYHLFKRVAPAELWKRVQFHGCDLSSLQSHIPPECLPERYGGVRQSVPYDVWLAKIKKYKDKEFDDELRALGYVVD